MQIQKPSYLSFCLYFCKYKKQDTHQMKLIIKTISICALLIIGFNSVTAQTNYKPIIYNAYINGDMSKWAQIIATIEKQNPQSTDAKLELISYYYGYTAFLIGTKNYETAAKYLERGDKHIDEILKTSPKNATAHAFKGSFIGFRIGLSKFKAIALGAESNRHVKLALEIDPQNIQGTVDLANSLYHTPKLFGGDKKEALKLFRKAMLLVEKSGHTQNNWFYLNILTLTAQTYESLEQYQQSKAQYEKILRFEPDYKWVKNELYPALLKKMK